MISCNDYIPKLMNNTNYNELSDQNKELIIKAEKGDADSLIYVINSFFFGQNNFPKSEHFGFKYLNYGVNQNIAKVLEQYGNFLLEGEVLPKDEEKAITFLNKAATIQRDPLLKLSIVNNILSRQSYDIYSTANSEVNYFLAKQICKEAADLGDAQAMRQYGFICLMNQKNKYGEIKADLKESFKYFSLSSERGDSESMFQLGTFYEFGLGGIEKDDQKAVKLYKESYEKGNLNACSFYGFYLISKHDDRLCQEKGLKMIKYSCDQKSPYGMNCYACVLNSGLAGVKKDMERSFLYIKKAADSGLHTAINNLGKFYLDGNVVQKDYEIALKYFKLAFSIGSIRSALSIANTYSKRESDSPSRDIQKAKRYFRLAIDFCYKEALNDYCIFLLSDSENLKENAPELRRYLELARKFNDLDTMRLQGALYMDGGDVYEKDVNMGVKIFKECAEKGCVDSMEYLVEIYETGQFEIEADPDEAKKYKEMKKKAQKE